MEPKMEQPKQYTPEEIEKHEKNLAGSKLGEEPSGYEYDMPPKEEQQGESLTERSVAIKDVWSGEYEPGNFRFGNSFFLNLSVEADFEGGYANGGRLKSFNLITSDHNNRVKVSPMMAFKENGNYVYHLNPAYVSLADAEISSAVADILARKMSEKISGAGEGMVRNDSKSTVTLSGSEINEALSKFDSQEDDDRNPEVASYSAFRDYLRRLSTMTEVLVDIMKTDDSNGKTSGRSVSNLDLQPRVRGY